MQNVLFVLQKMPSALPSLCVYFGAPSGRVQTFSPLLLIDVQHFSGRLQGRRSFYDGCECRRSYLFEVQETRCSAADLDIQKCVARKRGMLGSSGKHVCQRVPTCLFLRTSEGCFEWTNIEEYIYCWMHRVIVLRSSQSLIKRKLRRPLARPREKWLSQKKKRRKPFPAGRGMKKK